jgi:serine/threonine protein kinase
VLSVAELAAHPRAAALSDYKMVTQLGLGQFASVYHAVHLPTGTEVALKICSRPIQPPLPSATNEPRWSRDRFKIDPRWSAGHAAEIDPMDVDCFRLETSVLLELSLAAVPDAKGSPGADPWMHGATGGNGSGKGGRGGGVGEGGGSGGNGNGCGWNGSGGGGGPHVCAAAGHSRGPGATDTYLDNSAEALTAGSAEASPPGRYRPMYHAHGLAELDSRGLRGWIAVEFLRGHTLLRHLRPGIDAPPGAASSHAASPRAWPGDDSCGSAGGGGGGVLVGGGRMSLREVIWLLRDVAMELAQLHELGVIHRDLKETNVIVSPPSAPNQRPRARLIDFGLALRFLPPIDQVRTDFQLQQRVGVYGYMPPEVFRCEPYGWGVDIFAFGVLLYRSLKVALPRPKSAQLSAWAAQLPFKLARTNYRSYCAPRVTSGWPEGLASIVVRCCAADQRERPPMAKVVRELDAWLADGPKEREPETGAGAEGAQAWIADGQKEEETGRRTEGGLAPTAAGRKRNIVQKCVETDGGDARVAVSEKTSA